ncbi:MAG: GAF domain-containing sensor histidine kinase [Spirochaetales bacterium]|nr:GAF domain-containing sensor histidine kinase [Spirochaetales bacterium]
MLIRETEGGNPLVLYYNDPPSPDYPGSFSPVEKNILEHLDRRMPDIDTLEGLLEFLLSAGQELSPADRLSLVFLEEDGLRAVSRVVKTRYPEVFLQEGYTQDIREGSLPEVIEKGYPRVISDLAVYARLHPESVSSDLLVQEGLRSSMTCPLYTDDGKMVALFFRNSLRSRVYDEHQVNLHLAMAERLRQTVQKVYRIEELEKANRHYTEMLTFVSHELKSPLGSIVMDTNLILQGYLGDLSEKQKEKLTVITGKAEYLLGMIEDYLNLGRLENKELRMDIRKDVDFLSTVLEPALQAAASQAEEMDIRIERDYDLREALLSCDPGLMRIVMANLLSNGIKYGRTGGLLRVTLEATADRLTVRVYNTGPGFPASEKSRLFQKFSRLQTRELMSRKGTGVGLYTVWKIIKLHHGTVEASSEEHQWAEFRFSIPRKSP